MVFKILSFAALLVCAQAGVIQYSGHEAYAAPVAKFAYAAPVAKVAYAAPVAKVAYAAPIAKVAYATPVAKIAYAAPVAKIAYAAPVAKVAYAAPVAKVAYAAPVAKVAYAAPVAKVAYAAPIAKVAYAAPVAKYVAAPSYHHEEEEYGPAEYNFEYSVHDEHTGDIKSQKETRHGDQVQGSYMLIEADGSRRIVDYTADDHNGFNAVVRREEASHHVAVQPVLKKVVASLAVAAVPAYHSYHQAAPAYQSYYNH